MKKNQTECMISKIVADVQNDIIVHRPRRQLRHHDLGVDLL